MNDDGRRFVCAVHPDRPAAVDVRGVYKCWECYLPKERFLRKFGEDFYSGRPDAIVERRGRPAKGQKVKRKKAKDSGLDAGVENEKGLFG